MKLNPSLSLGHLSIQETVHNMSKLFKTYLMGLNLTASHPINKKKSSQLNQI